MDITSPKLLFSVLPEHLFKLNNSNRLWIDLLSNNNYTSKSIRYRNSYSTISNIYRFLIEICSKNSLQDTGNLTRIGLVFNKTSELLFKSSKDLLISVPESEFQNLLELQLDRLSRLENSDEISEFIVRMLLIYNVRNKFIAQNKDIYYNYLDALLFKLSESKSNNSLIPIELLSTIAYLLVKNFSDINSNLIKQAFNWDRIFNATNLNKIAIVNISRTSYFKEELLKTELNDHNIGEVSTKLIEHGELELGYTVLNEVSDLNILINILYENWINFSTNEIESYVRAITTTLVIENSKDYAISLVGLLQCYALLQNPEFHSSTFEKCVLDLYESYSFYNASRITSIGRIESEEVLHVVMRSFSVDSEDSHHQHICNILEIHNNDLDPNICIGTIVFLLNRAPEFGLDLFNKMLKSAEQKDLALLINLLCSSQDTYANNLEVINSRGSAIIKYKIAKYIKNSTVNAFTITDLPNLCDILNFNTELTQELVIILLSGFHDFHNLKPFLHFILNQNNNDRIVLNVLRHNWISRNRRALSVVFDYYSSLSSINIPMSHELINIISKITFDNNDKYDIHSWARRIRDPESNCAISYFRNSIYSQDTNELNIIITELFEPDLSVIQGDLLVQKLMGDFELMEIQTNYWLSPKDKSVLLSEVVPSYVQLVSSYSILPRSERMDILIDAIITECQKCIIDQDDIVLLHRMINSLIIKNLDHHLAKIMQTSYSVPKDVLILNAVSYLLNSRSTDKVKSLIDELGEIKSRYFYRAVGEALEYFVRIKNGSEVLFWLSYDQINEDLDVLIREKLSFLQTSTISNVGKEIIDVIFNWARNEIDIWSGNKYSPYVNSDNYLPKQMRQVVIRLNRLFGEIGKIRYECGDYQGAMNACSCQITDGILSYREIFDSKSNIYNIDDLFKWAYSNGAIYRTELYLSHREINKYLEIWDWESAIRIADNLVSVTSQIRAKLSIAKEFYYLKLNQWKIYLESALSIANKQGSIDDSFYSDVLQELVLEGYKMESTDLLYYYSESKGKRIIPGFIMETIYRKYYNTTIKINSNYVKNETQSDLDESHRIFIQSTKDITVSHDNNSNLGEYERISPSHCKLYPEESLTYIGDRLEKLALSYNYGKRSSYEDNKMIAIFHNVIKVNFDYDSYLQELVIKNKPMVSILLMVQDACALSETSAFLHRGIIESFDKSVIINIITNLTKSNYINIQHEFFWDLIMDRECIINLCNISDESESLGIGLYSSICKYLFNSSDFDLITKFEYKTGSKLKQELYVSILDERNLSSLCNLLECTKHIPLDKEYLELTINSDFGNKNISHIFRKNDIISIINRTSINTWFDTNNRYILDTIKIFSLWDYITDSFREKYMANIVNDEVLSNFIEFISKDCDSSLEYLFRNFDLIPINEYWIEKIYVSYNIGLVKEGYGDISASLMEARFI